MNKQELLNALNNELLGKKLGDRYDIENDLERVVKEQLKAELISENELRFIQVVKNFEYKSVYQFCYRGHFVTPIEVKKKQGDIHHGIFNTYHDWYYNGFKISTDFDFVSKAKEINKIIVENDKLEEQKRNNMFAIYKDLRAKYGKDIDSIISYLWANKWTLEKLYESEDK